MPPLPLDPAVPKMPSEELPEWMMAVSQLHSACASHIQVGPLCRLSTLMTSVPVEALPLLIEQGLQLYNLPLLTLTTIRA